MKKKVWNTPEVLATTSARLAELPPYGKAPFTAEYYSENGPGS